MFAGKFQTFCIRRLGNLFTRKVWRHYIYVESADIKSLQANNNNNNWLSTFFFFFWSKKKKTFWVATPTSQMCDHIWTCEPDGKEKKTHEPGNGWIKKRERRRTYSFQKTIKGRKLDSIRISDFFLYIINFDLISRQKSSSLTSIAWRHSKETKNCIYNLYSI